jgi:hypothetical protein
MQARIVQKVLEFEIKALAEGDYVEGLNFELFPISQEHLTDTNPEITTELKGEVFSESKEKVEDSENASEAVKDTPDIWTGPESKSTAINIVDKKEEIPYYHVIVASSTDKINLNTDAQKLLDKGKSVWIIFPHDSINNYRISVGKYKDYKSASKALEKAKMELAETSWILKY